MTLREVSKLPTKKQQREVKHAIKRIREAEFQDILAIGYDKDGEFTAISNNMPVQMAVTLMTYGIHLMMLTMDGVDDEE